MTRILITLLLLVHAQIGNTLEIPWYLSDKNLKSSPLSVKHSYLSIVSAMDKWSSACPITFKFMGFSNEEPLAHHSEFETPIFKTIIGWRALHEFQKDLSGSTTLITNMLDGTIVEGYLVLDPSRTLSNKEWSALLVHEVGHLIGLPHTKTPYQVMSYPYSTLENMQTLQEEDIERCNTIGNQWRDFGEITSVD